MKHLLPALGALVLASVLTTTSLAQNHEPTTQNPVKQLTAITTLMDSIPDIIFYKDLDGVTGAATKPGLSWPAKRRTSLSARRISTYFRKSSPNFSGRKTARCSRPARPGEMKNGWSTRMVAVRCLIP